MSVMDSSVLPVVCPKCGAQIQKSVVWFRQNRELGCPCGTTIYLETDELITIIDQLEGALGRLIRPAPEE
jgi:NAD-dependent SIR2 family protein deacetylase